MCYLGNTCIIWFWCPHLNLMPSADRGDSPVPQHKMPGELNRSENPRVRGDNLTRLIRSTCSLTNALCLAFGQMHFDWLGHWPVLSGYLDDLGLI